MVPFFKGPEASDEDRAKCLELIKKFLDTIEERCKDGRKYFAGAQITACDFKVLASTVGFFENPNGKVPEFNQAMNEEYCKHENVKRICETLKSENGLAAYIQELYANKWTF